MKLVKLEDIQYFFKEVSNKIAEKTLIFTLEDKKIALDFMKFLDLLQENIEQMAYEDYEKNKDAIPVSFVKSYINENNLDDEKNDPWTYYMYALLTNWLNEPEKDKWYETD